MRPSLPRLVKVIPKSQLAQQGIPLQRTLPEPVRSDIKQPTLIELLMKRRADAGESYPSNIRIEPELKMAHFRRFPKEVGMELKEMAREK
ncbi:uncharacterized protein C8Q71DRAFT_199117 [Rhodofomes roseus]|uniref:Uncharacterized protein n=1 Tax=Rhodofomes roseus TaxID=34475 RepID=A0A4Y9YI62_9APHY|nr:uncharacterized protein C8Q71DRAFT_199117 [Rhodofomes roseus]KAH9842333.1 hypothetical protein C8Q71DRAFT_199117 [Rhodofomes roseus]TFY60629.1 hypothetical protein EVJ58_g5015 [Rhodofomes roseus]